MMRSGTIGTLAAISAAIFAGAAEAAPPAQARAGAYASLPEGLASFGAALAGDWLYVYGGHLGKPHDHSAANVTGRFQRLNLANPAAWESLPSGEPMQGTALVESGGALYRIGGMIPKNATTNDPVDLHSTDDVERFDPSKGKWEKAAKLPIGLSSHDAIADDGRIYVIGGWTLSGGATGDWNAKAWALDTRAAAPEWEELAAPPFKRRALSVVALGGKIHAMGGMETDDSFSKKHDIYDPATKTWGAGPGFPEGGFGMSACIADGNVYASAMKGTLYRYAGAEWEALGALKTPRFFHRFVPLANGRILAIAGSQREGHLADLEEIETAGEGAKQGASAPKVESWEIPFPGAARNRQCVFFTGKALAVFGGNNSAEQHDFEPENFVDEGFAIDLETKRIKPAAPFPRKRQSMLTAAGMAFGGFGHAGDGKGARTHSEIFAYDFAADKWETLGATVPKPLTQFGVVERDGAVWIFGGMDFDPARGAKKQFQIQTSVYRWDRKTGAKGFEETEFKLPEPRRAFGSELMDGKFYLVGGMKEEFAPIEGCDVFDFEKKAWEKIPGTGHPFISPEVASLDGQLYLACGSVFTEKDGFQANTSLMRYDAAAGAWKNVMEKIDGLERHAKMFASDGRLVIYAITQDGDRKARVITIKP